MRILYITHYSEMYGANIALLNMALYLKDKYNIIPVVLLPQNGSFIRLLDEKGIQHINCYWNSWVGEKEETDLQNPVDVDSFDSGNFTKILRSILDNNMAFDLIHTNSSVTNIGAYLAKNLSLPHIWHIREDIEDYFNQRFICGRERACTYMEEYSERVIFVSNALRKRYDRSFSSNKIKVIYDGALIRRRMADKSFSYLDTKPVVNFLFTGFIHENKNQMEALKAADVLKNNYGIENFIIYFAGGGSLSYLQMLRKYVREKGLSSNVKFLGYVENMDELIKDMDIGLICSTQEAFGLVTAENMLAQMPVIGSNSGATPEIVEHGATGYLYNLGDYEELAGYMKELIVNRSNIVGLALAGYKRAKEMFTSELNAENIYNEYCSIVVK